MDDLTSAGTPAPPRPPASVPSGRGSAWWTEGWRLFVAAPGPWIAITLIFVVLMVMIMLIPILRHVVPTLLTPVFAGGVFMGCRALDRGGGLTVGHLFASFSDRLGPLIIVGIVYLIGSLVIVAVVIGCMIATVGIGEFTALVSGDPFQASFALLTSVGLGALLALLVGLLLGIPLLMAYWYAPALVVFRNDEPLAAMKASFKACLVNMLPMLVYGLLGLVFAIAASIPLGLGWLVLGPVFAASVYASYKDIFGAPD
jgi:uncharacterized membrane protein